MRDDCQARNPEIVGAIVRDQRCGIEQSSRRNQPVATLDYAYQQPVLLPSRPPTGGRGPDWKVQPRIAADKNAANEGAVDSTGAESPIVPVQRRS